MSENVKNYLASAAIAAKRLVTLDGGTVQQAAAITNNIMGVCVQPQGAASGDRCDVAHSGIFDVEAGAAIAAGLPITSDADGKAIAAAPASGANARTAGYTLEAAGADGDYIRVMIGLGEFQGE